MENETVIEALFYELFKLFKLDRSDIGVKLYLDLLSVFHFDYYHNFFLRK